MHLQSRPLPQLLAALSLATQPQGTTQACTPKHVTMVIVLEGIRRACAHGTALSPCARNATISQLSNSKLLLVLVLLLLLLLPLSLPAYHVPQPACHMSLPACHKACLTLLPLPLLLLTEAQGALQVSALKFLTIVIIIQGMLTAPAHPPVSVLHARNATISQLSISSLC